MTTQKRDWVRIIGITGATLVIAGGITLGSMKVAEATGYVTLPARAGHMKGDGFGMDGAGRMNGGRAHRQHRDGQMNGQGMMGGQGMGFGRSGQAVTGDGQIVQHVLMMLQSEQHMATDLGASESVAQTIAATRAAEITAITALQKQWYPDATAVTPPVPTKVTSIDELRQGMLHHSQMLEQINAAATYEHPELATWIQTTLAKRATEITTLYTK
ncbi:MAG: hypothetical protein DWI55_02995 [Chloroflexi bacterium]|nr:MAG: hypothetical protein DWI55_02995 [Chloroflexota bacterium]